MNKNNNFSYFPILIDLKQFPVLVIGGGNIAHRKINNLLSFNADITVLSPEINTDIKLLITGNKIKFINREYRENDVENFKLVFCATNNKTVDKLIQKDCKKLGILLNVADVPNLCNFIMPATIQRGALTVSIGSQGKAPFYVRETKKRLNDLLSPYTSDIVNIANAYRDKMIETKIYYNVKARENLINAFFKIDFDNIIRTEGYDIALKTALQIIDGYNVI